MSLGDSGGQTPGSRRGHARIAAGLFAGLGTQVGAWAVLIPFLVASRGLSPAALGAALALMAATSIAALAAAGPLADRFGRRPLAVAGAAGFAGAFTLLALVDAQAALWPTMALYGLASGCLDLAANAVGTDYERAHAVRAMIRLHAGFSAAAAAAALGAAVLAAAASAATAYGAVAVLYVALAAAAARAPLPPHEAGKAAPPGGDAPPAGHEPSPAAPRPAPVAAGGRLALLRTPAVAVAVALCTLCFFGDGAIEGYAALFLESVLAAGTLTVGAAFAAFHGASLAGRLLSARLADARGERWVLTAAGLLASAGMALTLLAAAPAPAAAGLLVVGFALAPVIPTALSLAGRGAPGQSATAVSLVTTVGYSAFVAGPPLVGLLAGATSLRVALVPVVATTASLALLARLRAAPLR